MPTAAPHSRFLELGALAALQHQRFTTRHRIEGAYSGRHQSRQQGGAGEFVDYREYSAGEDLRRLDWKVLARTGKAYVRLFQDETNLSCTIAIDASRSMTFGEESQHRDGRGRSKLEYVQYLATALSHVVLTGQDRVGLAILGDDLVEHIPCGGTETQLRQVHDRIEHLESRATTRLAEGLRTLFQRSPARGVLLLASDFLVDDLEEVFAAARLFRHRQSEVIALHLIHPGEERLPEGAAFRFEGLEGEGRLDCSPRDVRDAYRRRFEAHLEAVRTLAISSGCDYHRVSTAVPYLQTLGRFLVERVG